jgi:hypothetical protein
MASQPESLSLWRPAFMSGRHFVFRGGDVSTADGQFRSMEEAAAEAERRNSAVVVVAEARAITGNKLIFLCGNEQPVGVIEVTFNDAALAERFYRRSFRVTIEPIRGTEVALHLAALRAVASEGKR